MRARNANGNCRGMAFLKPRVREWEKDKKRTRVLDTRDCHEKVGRGSRGADKMMYRTRILNVRLRQLYIFG